MRRWMLVLTAIAVSGCGGSPATAPPAPRTWSVHWHEVASVGGRPVLTVEVTRIHFDTHGFTVSASLENVSGTTIHIVRPDLPAGAPASWTWFGITVGTGAPRTYIAHADRYAPRPPAALKPGHRWRGTFSGPPVPRGDPHWHVTFGIFEPDRRLPGLPPRFAWVTDHAVSDALHARG